MFRPGGLGPGAMIMPWTRWTRLGVSFLPDVIDMIDMASIS